MTMEELRGLGAPVLPEGQYYHIHGGVMGDAYLSIRKERKYLWDRTLTEVRVYRYASDDTLQDPQTAIRSAAVRAVDLYTKKTPEQIWWEHFLEWEGKHK